ncbi:hypothetical protein PpBr36_01914 [Pyricularia pennisetigena]|uniref:hypothetical protein n=1 Tax=Pyricularia pennisetigena TaxID=1578925 RepID=UPI00114F1C2B|nr:hypothetical protein PpBr36_01914 [Pyricularia pennisetigena]TLS29557.1 hypothetical protein PpBr36_01914 [Pyricularia pennisetigena]
MAYHDPGVGNALDWPARQYVVAHAGRVPEALDLDAAGIGGCQARAEPVKVGAALHRHARETELGPEYLLQQTAEAGRGADGHERMAREVRVCSLGCGWGGVDGHCGQGSRCGGAGDCCIHALALLVMSGGVDRGWSTGRLLVPRQPIKVLNLGAAEVVCQRKIAALTGSSG